MLFNFIGCPQSGKTTTAAMVFASMKEVSRVAEFCPEQARFYIARRRVRAGLRPQDHLALDDADQFEIMKAQLEADEVLVKACGPEVIIVSDSSPLNSMLYMSPWYRKTKEVQDMALRSLEITKTSFYAQPIYRPYQQDPNRIHDEEQSRAIDKLIPELLQEYPGLNVAEIHGTVSERLLICQDRIFFPK
jgi:hypothetical protein